MKKNVGSYDVAVRFVGGALIILLGRHTLGWWSLLAVIPVVSSMTSFCLFYAALGISTTACDERDAREKRAVRAGR